MGTKSDTNQRKKKSRKKQRDRYKANKRKVEALIGEGGTFTM